MQRTGSELVSIYGYGDIDLAEYYTSISAPNTVANVENGSDIINGNTDETYIAKYIEGKAQSLRSFAIPALLIFTFCSGYNYEEHMILINHSFLVSSFITNINEYKMLPHKVDGSEYACPDIENRPMQGIPIIMI